MSYIELMNEGIHGHKRKLLYFIDRIEHLRSKQGITPTKMRILDVGCGNGTQVTLPLGEQGYTILGLDFHRPSVEYAKAQNPFPDVSFAVQDVTSLAFEEAFNVIICSDVLEHLPYPERLLEAFQRLLDPDGIVLVSIPNGFGPFEIENFLLRIGVLGIPKRMIGAVGKMLGLETECKEYAPYNAENGHVQFFSMGRFKKLVASLGYRITGFQKVCFMGAPFSSMLLARVPLLIRWNVGIAAYLPYFMCSQWVFELRRNLPERTEGLNAE